MPRVLLIEDNELNRDMLSRRLRRKGYEVVVAEDGASGVSQARASRPDLVIMDLGLPVMDGWEATRLLKGAPETATVPIIALTAHAMPSERRRAMEAGCDDYDTKPVELDRLLGKIEALLGAE
jgi:CheY-like chemotaxis protein